LVIQIEREIDLWGASNDLTAIVLRHCQNARLRLGTNKVKTRNEIEELREENRQLRELVAHLSKLALGRISEAAEPKEQSTSAAS
jgi:hypothetical protein